MDKDDIMSTFDKNFARINNLISIYKTLESGKSKGRRNTHNLDILRSCVVLIHSTLEDYLRNVLAIRLPFSEPDVLNTVPLKGSDENGRNLKFTMGSLAASRGKTIEKVIEESVIEYLQYTSFNNTKDIVNFLKKIRIEPKQDQLTKLSDLIKRRHNIVHNADKSRESGKGKHRIESISLRQVDSWKKAVDKFVGEVNKHY